ncbi:Cytochrome p-450 [Rhizoctonia solani]|uniref:Cytochrome p-450 n=1 Tax=Rhizoctonia solani TaxID=456999 RepID=A0A8H7HAE7_9AGAM|nr:Cytochrome p-450 [Rhizoctonia solani]
MNNWLNSQAVTQFCVLQEQQTRQLLRELLKATSHAQPFEYVKNRFFFSMGSLMLQLAYGYKPQTPQDNFFEEAQLAFHNVHVASMQTSFLINLFPVLSHIPDWFPGTGWKLTAREWRAQQNKAKTKPYEWLKSQVVSLTLFARALSMHPTQKQIKYVKDNGTHQLSLLGPLLKDHVLLSDLSLTDRDERLKEIGIILFGGGTDTSANFLVNFVLAMVLNPHVQVNAQRELDAIIGRAVLPSTSDKERLPYIRNLVDEVLRLYPILPLGRDPQHYKDPEVFNPDRYLDPNVPRPPVFGWGRRKCPGIHFAENSTFVAAASLLAFFDFSKKKGSDMQEIVPQVELERNSLILIGVSGFTLGGGLGPFSHNCGIGINSVLKLKFVTASEELVELNREDECKKN